MARQHRDVEETIMRQRSAKVWQYRLMGFTQREIAEKLGISIDTVRRDIERVKVEYPEQTVKQLTLEQNEKLREMMKPQYIKAIKGDIKAAEVMLKMFDHQAKLFGLYDAQVDNGQSDAMAELGRFMTATIEAVKGKGE